MMSDILHVGWVLFQLSFQSLTTHHISSLKVFNEWMTVLVNAFRMLEMQSQTKPTYSLCQIHEK